MPYSILGDIQTLTLSNEAECDNPCCILTLNCDVLLMGNITLTNYTANSIIATLPSSMRSESEIAFPCFLDNQIAKVLINTAGEISIDMDCTSGTLYLNGKSFNCASQYYNSSIGNNFSQGTAPLRWDGEVY